MNAFILFIPSDKTKLDQLCKSKMQVPSFKRDHEPSNIPKASPDSFLRLSTRGLFMIYIVTSDSPTTPTVKFPWKNLGIPTWTWVHINLLNFVFLGLPQSLVIQDCDHHMDQWTSKLQQPSLVAVQGWWYLSIVYSSLFFLFLSFPYIFLYFYR